MPAAQSLSQRFDPKLLAALEGQDFKARYVMEGFLSGLHDSPFHGFSVEFRVWRTENSTTENCRPGRRRSGGQASRLFLSSLDHRNGRTSLASFCGNWKAFRQPVVPVYPICWSTPSDSSTAAASSCSFPTCSS